MIIDVIDVIDVILVFVKCYEAKGFCWVGSETMAAYLVLLGLAWSAHFPKSL